MAFPGSRLQWLQQRVARSYTSVAGSALYRCIRASIDRSKVEAIGHRDVLEAKAAKRRLIFVGWHGHDYANIGVYHPLFGFDSRALLMVPDTPGGAILKETARRMRLEVVPLQGTQGSTQASRAVVSVIKLVSRGYDALLAVDGPAGPALQAKPGAALVAQRAGAVIVPTAVASTRSVRLRYRWDDHLVPVPGGRVVVHFGPLIDTANEAGASIEEITHRVAFALTAGTQIAGQRCTASHRG